MKSSAKFLLGGFVAALFSLNLAAQPAPAAGPCAKARDPQRCEALQAAKETCKDKATPEKGKCMSDAMPPMDCSKARSPARCEALQKAKDACKDKNGAEHRQCIRAHTPKRGGQPAAPKN